jgi:hypothetical protein
MKPRDVGTGLPSHVGGEVVVTYGGIPTPVDGRVRDILMLLMRLEGEPQRLLDVIAMLLAEREDMGLERRTVYGVSFDWSDNWLNWDIKQGRRRQKQRESEAA